MLIGNAIGVGFGVRRKVIVSDSFNRTDNATTLGKAETGQPYTVGTTPWGISNNQAYSVGTTGTDFAYINTGAFDVTASAQVTFSVNEGVAVRIMDIGNYLVARINGAGIGLFRVIADVATQIGSYAFTPVVGTSYKVKMVCGGSSINVFLDGVLRITASETFNSKATSHGFRVTASTAGRFDNFLVEAL